MTRKTIIWGVMVLGCTVQVISGAAEDSPTEYMSKEDREALKEEARDMFYHAYNAYMANAYPADELMPLSCKGRYRGSEPDRGDIDSTLGNFSLTLVDTLDTLVVLGDLGEFENAVRLVVKDVTFDTDVIVSLFETNIRMLGGLLSGHILAEYLQSRADIMPWYRGELLNLAKDLGYRFLPAFNTTTGIPFGRINLRHGMKGVPAEMCRETCTACAGSMILEMAALSRLTGESIFEDKAQKAMDALWKMRHRGTDLMGSVLNVHSGDWVRRDSGVGAGIDSYYEYCLKAYILLGDEKYLGRFNKHYQAVMKYVSQGPMLLDVHMHRPNTNSKNFMDALLAFWPGLQVLKGDIKPAVETHEMLYQVMQRHNFIPEAFTTDFQVHWGHHPLRPEFLESTYFLYRATGDHYYLGVGQKVLKSLQTYARVTCGYAAVSDVRTNKHDDTMDSFVLSETLKYLYLLFAEPNDLVLDLDEFIFTTEGHLLPLTLAAVRTNVTSDLDRDIVQVDELGRTCPNSLHLFPASVRQPLRNMVEDVCPRRSLKRRLIASQFQANNLEHLNILSNMGITILTSTAGRVQVLHKFSNARSAQDAEEGILFMQEIVELSKKKAQQTATPIQSVTYTRTDVNPPREITVVAGPAHFGPIVKEGQKITGEIKCAIPTDACSELTEPEELVGKIVLVTRGNCMFIEKARRIQQAGAIAGIILDTVPNSSAETSPLFSMSGDGREPDDVTIPVVFLFNNEATDLLVARIAHDGFLKVTIGVDVPRVEKQLKAPGDLSVFERLKGSVKDFLVRHITPQHEIFSVFRAQIPYCIFMIKSQNTDASSRGSEILGSQEMFGPSKKSLPNEFEIVGFHLKGSLIGRASDLRITRTDWPPPDPKNIPIDANIDRSFMNMRQNLVNDIYSSKERSVTISQAKIRYQYVMQFQENSDPPSAFALMEWFLKELRGIAPDASILREGTKIDEDTKKERTLEELLELSHQKRPWKRAKEMKNEKISEETTTNDEIIGISSESADEEMTIGQKITSKALEQLLDEAARNVNLLQEIGNIMAKSGRDGDPKKQRNFVESLAIMLELNAKKRRTEDTDAAIGKIKFDKTVKQFLEHVRVLMDEDTGIVEEFDPVKRQVWGSFQDMLVRLAVQMKEEARTREALAQNSPTLELKIDRAKLANKSHNEKMNSQSDEINGYLKDSENMKKSHEQSKKRKKEEYSEPANNPVEEEKIISKKSESTGENNESYESSTKHAKIEDEDEESRLLVQISNEESPKCPEKKSQVPTGESQEPMSQLKSTKNIEELSHFEKNTADFPDESNQRSTKDGNKRIADDL